MNQTFSPASMDLGLSPSQTGLTPEEEEQKRRKALGLNPAQPSVFSGGAVGSLFGNSSPGSIGFMGKGY